VIGQNREVCGAAFDHIHNRSENTSDRGKLSSVRGLRGRQTEIVPE
jgi:hypothetical protein